MCSSCSASCSFFFFFFFNDPATTEIYTLSLHDALPIYRGAPDRHGAPRPVAEPARPALPPRGRVRSEEHTSDSSHTVISYAVFCLKKKKKTKTARDAIQREPE